MKKLLGFDLINMQAACQIIKIIGQFYRSRHKMLQYQFIIIMKGESVSPLALRNSTASGRLLFIFINSINRGYEKNCCF
jgi:hypothetical protein